jgi:NAD(P)H-dependent FMN reductase
MLTLEIIIGSTRPGRVGKPVADWFDAVARRHGGFEVELLDLAEIALPFLDEPHHPAQQKYTKQHTKDWAATIARGDAYVLVTSEYNHGYPAALKNALDFVYREWNGKPVGFVSYGGISGGTRSVQQLRQITSALQLYSVPAVVHIPFAARHMQDGAFVADEALEKSATALLGELQLWGARMKSFRVEATS